MVNSDPIYLESRKENIGEFKKNIQRAESLSSGSVVTKGKDKDSS